MDGRFANPCELSPTAVITAFAPPSPDPRQTTNPNNHNNRHHFLRTHHPSPSSLSYPSSPSFTTDHVLLHLHPQAQEPHNHPSLRPSLHLLRLVVPLPLVQYAAAALAVPVAIRIILAAKE